MSGGVFPGDGTYAFWWLVQTVFHGQAVGQRMSAIGWWGVCLLHCFNSCLEIALFVQIVTKYSPKIDHFCCWNGVLIKGQLSPRSSPVSIVFYLRCRCDVRDVEMEGRNVEGSKCKASVATMS
ncbi:unnamed protein product [Litomosoides sigmodontis]|uniref:Uncharacterized protein n=1 Tax=Litomosoides sigmodontis TaxID=42156 RepID=A0A3P6TJH6_LITSI|nr:unnamed protein product [Litomosoides sigmodontis]